jgi:hypothetical protein
MSKILPDDPDTVIATVEPGGARRVFATAVVGFLGTLLIYIAATHPPVDLIWLLFLIVMGVGSLFLSWRLWEATSRTLELTGAELREAGGRVLFALDEVASVDRGFFAFKPSNGFLVRLKTRTSRGGAYAPGLWWRLGRTVMVGGATSGGQAKSIADLIKVMLAERAAG